MAHMMGYWFHFMSSRVPGNKQVQEEEQLRCLIMYIPHPPRGTISYFHPQVVLYLISILNVENPTQTGRCPEGDSSSMRLYAVRRLVGFLVGLLVGFLTGFFVGFLVGFLVGWSCPSWSVASSSWLWLWANATAKRVKTRNVRYSMMMIVGFLSGFVSTIYLYAGSRSCWQYVLLSAYVIEMLILCHTVCIHLVLRSSRLDDEIAHPNMKFRPY